MLEGKNRLMPTNGKNVRLGTVIVQTARALSSFIQFSTMPNIPKQLNFLNRISFNTPKAHIRLDPSRYSGLKLVFQYENHNGQMGARKFWNQYLPTLKFYNPELQMDVVRIRNSNQKDGTTPCYLEALDRDGRVIDTLQMKNKHSDAIMDEFNQLFQREQIPEDELIQLKRN